MEESSTEEVGTGFVILLRESSECNVLLLAVVGSFDFHINIVSSSLNVAIYTVDPK